MHESILLLLPPTTYNAPSIATRMHDYCAIYDAPPTPLLYAIQHTILVIAISCKGQTGREFILPSGGCGRRRLRSDIALIRRFLVHL